MCSTFLLLLVLGSYEVTASDTRQSKWRRVPVKYYWNIPTFQCDTHRLNFTGLAEKYGIIQNPGDRFRGDNLVILYDPGNFPAILKNGRNEVIYRNGGVPQEGNLNLHLSRFQDLLKELIPDPDFHGLGIIDFESWRPVFRQNFGSLSPYKDLSVEIEKQEHPYWSKNLLEKEATRRFEFYARTFMEETLFLAKDMRPNATWGYYAYPYCFNMSPSNMKKACPNEVTKENDRTNWLFNMTDNFYPSLYLSSQRLNSKDKVQMIEGRINECHRIIGNLATSNHKIMPYFWYKYQDSKTFVTKEDLFNSFFLLSTMNIDGLVIWGSSNDVNTKQKCIDLYNYVDTTLGPSLIDHFS